MDPKSEAAMDAEDNLRMIMNDHELETKDIWRIFNLDIEYGKL